MVKLSSRVAVLGVLLAVVGLVGACGTAAPTGAKSFTFAFPGPFGVGEVTLLAAMDDLRGEGYTIETPQVDDPSLIAQGVSQGQFQFTQGDTVAALRTMQAGGKLKIVGEQIGNVWQIVTDSEIQACADLSGRSVGVFAVGSFNDASVRAYIFQNCPGTEVEMLVLGDSTARAAAMLAGTLDASPLEIGDAVPLLIEGGDRFHVLADLAKTLPGLRPSAIVANTDFLAANAGTVRALLKAHILQNRKVADDPAYLRELILKYVPAIDQSNLDQVIEAFTTSGLFDVNGGVTADNLEYTMQFFVGSQSIQPGLTLETVADLSHLDAVLVDVGRK
jgi:NitT/TauT family transport system substrate-binding protein